MPKFEGSILDENADLKKKIYKINMFIEEI